MRGDNALTGTYNGKQEVGELWEKFARKDFRTDPHEFIADGDKVVVLTTIHLEGEAVESADILTYSGGWQARRVRHPGRCRGGQPGIG